MAATGPRHGEGADRTRSLAITGPTASGKSDVALALARRFTDVELVSVDSMSVYRGMDIGTAKPSPAVRAEVPYHLLDLVDPSHEYTVQEFQLAARTVLADIAERGHRAVLVGGTGLYLRSVIDDLELPGRFPDVVADLEAELNAATDAVTTATAQQTVNGAESSGLVALHDRLARLDPVAASKMAPTNRRRVIRALEVTLGSGRPFSSFGPGLGAYPPSGFQLVGIPFDAPVHDRRIEERFTRMLRAGLLEEVAALAARPGGLSRTARQALGYRELLSHLEAGVPFDDAVDEALRRTRAFARRQRSWFRRDPRIVWLEAGTPVPVADDAGDSGEGAGNPTGEVDRLVEQIEGLMLP